MEYTKDIILNVNYKKEICESKIKLWTSRVYNYIKENRLISITLTTLVILITIDIALVNSFLQILSNLY